MAGVAAAIAAAGAAAAGVGVAAAAAVAVVVVVHPDLGNGQLSFFITTSALPDCADRSVTSSEYRWSENQEKLS